MYELDARLLHAAARDPESDMPDVFREANENVAEARSVAQEWTAARHRLIYEARQIGIPYPALARWTGMHVSTLAEITQTEMLAEGRPGATEEPEAEEPDPEPRWAA